MKKESKMADGNSSEECEKGHNTYANIDRTWWASISFREYSDDEEKYKRCIYIK